MRHALIGKNERDGIVARFQLAQSGEAGVSRFGAHHSVFLSVMPAEIALDRSQHFGIVIDGQQNRLRHSSWDERRGAPVTSFRLRFFLASSSRYNSRDDMSSALPAAIAMLSSSDASERAAGARDIYRAGRELADEATREWLRDAEFAGLVNDGSGVYVNVGLAVRPITFATIRKANGAPRLADVPPDQDAQEFELHFEGGIALDVLTSVEPEGSGAIARYLSKFDEGIQQVEYRCGDVDRAAAILKGKFGIAPVYPETRPGADETRINFFLTPLADGSKVLIELYEAGPHRE